MPNIKFIIKELLNQFKIPKLLAITQSEVFKRRKAREKLTIIVVKVKN